MSSTPPTPDQNPKAASPAKAKRSSQLSGLFFTPETIVVSVNGVRQRLRKDEPAYQAFLVLGFDAADYYLRQTGRGPQTLEGRRGLLSRLGGMFKKNDSSLAPPPPVTGKPALPGQQPPATPIPALDAIGAENGCVQTTWQGGQNFSSKIDQCPHLAQSLETCYLELRALGIQKVAGIDGRAHKPVSKESITSHLKSSPANEAKDAAAHARQFEGRAANPVEEANAAPKPRQPKKQHAGVFMESDWAPYHHDKNNSKSFFVILRVRDEKEPNANEIVWGVDLERALKEADAYKGDRVRLLYHGSRTVTVKVPVYDANHEKILRYELQSKDRNEWEVQMIEPGPEHAKRKEEAAMAEAQKAKSKNKAKPEPDPSEARTHADMAGPASTSIPEPVQEAPTSGSPEVEAVAAQPIDSDDAAADAHALEAAAQTGAEIQSPVHETPLPKEPQLLPLDEEQQCIEEDAEPVLVLRGEGGKRWGLRISPETQTALRPLLLKKQVMAVAFAPVAPTERKGVRQIVAVALTGSEDRHAWPLPAPEASLLRFTPGSQPIVNHIDKDKNGRPKPALADGHHPEAAQGPEPEVGG